MWRWPANKPSEILQDVCIVVVQISCKNSAEDCIQNRPLPWQARIRLCWPWRKLIHLCYFETLRVFGVCLATGKICRLNSHAPWWGSKRPRLSQQKQMNKYTKQSNENKTYKNHAHATSMRSMLRSLFSALRLLVVLADRLSSNKIAGRK